MHQGAIAMIKLESGCVDCGYNEDPDALEFDHVRGTKVRSVAGTGLVGSINQALNEIEKCEVRCSNCHSIVTAERRRSL